jgi:malonyl-CoA/methylmalonyl-CoA synthetase
MHDLDHGSMTQDANLYSLFEARFAEAGDAPALVPQDGTAPLTYSDLADAVGRYANAFEALGVGPGDRITVQVEKSLANVFAYLAALKTGAVYQPLNTGYTAAEVDYFVEDAKPSLIVGTPAREGDLRAIATRHGSARVVTLDENGAGSLADEAAGCSAEHVTVSRAREDLACLVYTSGTTGRSKGAMITHGNLASNATTLHQLWGFRPGDVLLHALPIFHVHGLHVALHTTFLNASPMLWLPKFDLEKVLSLLPQASVLMGVPTFYTRLLSDERFTKALCRGMRLFISGSAPLLAETHDAFAERTGHRILERYGMTECGMITSNPYDGERLAGTVGYPLPGVSVRVSAEGGGEVPRGDIGVLEVKGPNVFSGYWNMPDKTAEEFRDDGYFITGDLATVAEDGRIAIVGRAKDLIISGGYNIYPKEIEGEIDEIEGIGESAVIGVPHPDFGEGVVAVITAAGAAAVPGEADILGALAGKLAKFKLPKRVFQVDTLPRNTMGKVQKAELRKLYGDTFKG